MSHELNDQQLLSAYMDGELTAAERTAIESRLPETEELRQLLEDWRNQQLKLQSLPQKKLNKDISETVLQSIQSNQNHPPQKEFRSRRMLVSISTVAALLSIIMLLNISAVNERLGRVNTVQKTELAVNIQPSSVGKDPLPATASMEREPFWSSNASTVDEDQQLMLRQRLGEQAQRMSIQADQNPESTIMALPPRSVPYPSLRFKIDSSPKILFVDISNQIEGLKRVGEILKTNQIQIATEIQIDPNQAGFPSSTVDSDQQLAGRRMQKHIYETESLEIDRPAIAEIKSAYAPGIEAILVVAKKSQVDQVIDQLRQQAKTVSFDEADVSQFAKDNVQSEVIDNNNVAVMGGFGGIRMDQANQSNIQAGEVAKEKIGEPKDVAQSPLEDIGGIGRGLRGGDAVRNAQGNAQGKPEEQTGRQQPPNEWVKILLLIKVTDQPDP